ncbi:hypothetical protein [Marinobacterium sedimentorum]|uniref:hypothetical protein n=1 Tax=Marinobacterium sedimentorum TaxID=2927804 RepID=UPI0020C71335|nr:hypothetical protein [Marinobacterium sedimentorum]MCP8687751.1 hypothetical protein [Marinobacterium sedimentorum]
MPIQKISPGVTNAETAANSINQAIDLAEQNAAEKVDKAAGKGLSTNDYSTAEQAKLAAIAAGATANASDAQLRDRASHTGEQPVSSVTGLQAGLDAKLAKAGDTVTTVSEVTDSSASATLDWAVAMVFVRTITADTEFDFTNVPTVGSTKRELHLLGAGAWLMTWPASDFVWVGGEAPTLGTVDRVILNQYEGDSTVYAEHRSVTA